MNRMNLRSLHIELVHGIIEELGRQDIALLVDDYEKPVVSGISATPTYPRPKRRQPAELPSAPAPKPAAPRRHHHPPRRRHPAGFVGRCRKPQRRLPHTPHPANTAITEPKTTANPAVKPAKPATKPTPPGFLGRCRETCQFPVLDHASISPATHHRTCLFPPHVPSGPAAPRPHSVPPPIQACIPMLLHLPTYQLNINTTRHAPNLHLGPHSSLHAPALCSCSPSRHYFVSPYTAAPSPQRVASPPWQLRDLTPPPFYLTAPHYSTGSRTALSPRHESRTPDIVQRRRAQVKGDYGSPFRRHRAPLAFHARSTEPSVLQILIFHLYFNPSTGDLHLPFISTCQGFPWQSSSLSRAYRHSPLADGSADAILGLYDLEKANWCWRDVSLA
ncbi:hypothetical protein C8J57DRAFT_1509197 [Mycena rebaudengoi]|nr:hypothetical protein C8J57DRAFT_1509197 [Mycena rebaudengoi]